MTDLEPRTGDAPGSDRDDDAAVAGRDIAEGEHANRGVLLDLLRSRPKAFELFQAVRLLERLNPDRGRVGEFGAPGEEAVRFGANPSLAFPTSEIAWLEEGEEDEPVRVGVNVMGLVGPLGVLPHEYTRLVDTENVDKQPALGAFLDIFQHRMTSLFYRAWKKHRFTVSYEESQEDPLSGHLLDLVGLGSTAVQGLSDVDDLAFVFYAGLLCPPQRGALALEQLIQDFFSVPVEVQQFVGGWYPVSETDLSRVGEPDTISTMLGQGATVGDEVWDQQARVRIRVGPLSRAVFDEFLPGGAGHTRLRALTRFFAQDQFEFEVQLVLAPEDVPPVQLGAPEDANRLGWSTWIRSTPRMHDADDTVLTL